MWAQKPARRWPRQERVRQLLLPKESRRWKEQVLRGCKEKKKTIRHLPCSISRTVIPTSIAQYSGFFMFTDVLLVWRSVSSQGKKKNTACDSPKKKKKNPEKCFSSSPRSCWLTGGYSIHQRSAQQSPSFSCEGGRRCARQVSSTEGGHNFRFAGGLFYFPRRAEIAKVAALILKKRDWKQSINFLSGPGCIVASLKWRSTATCGGAAVHCPTEIYWWKHCRDTVYLLNSLCLVRMYTAVHILSLNMCIFSKYKFIL